MDRILSARVDEAVLKRIGVLAKRLNTTRKAIIEQAILAYAEKIQEEQKFDILEQTHGAWQRDESSAETVARARKAFRESMERHHP